MSFTLASGAKARSVTGTVRITRISKYNAATTKAQRFIQCRFILNSQGVMDIPDSHAPITAITPATMPTIAASPAAAKGVNVTRTKVLLLSRYTGNAYGPQPTLLGARQIELAVGLPAADIAAVIELAVDRMHMAVEHQRTRVQRAPPISGLAQQPQGRRQQTCRQLIIVGAWFSSHEQLLSPQTGRRRNHLFQVLACAAHRGSLPRWLRVERRSPLSSHGLGVAIRRSGRAERSQPGTCEPAPYDEDLPLDCGSADAWRLEACGGWCGARRRARQLPA